MTEPQSELPDDAPELVVVTGLSGAGRSTVGNVMEDHGWHVIDNLPIALLPQLLRISESPDPDGREREAAGIPTISRPARIGIVLDVRAHGFDTLVASLETLRERGWHTRLVYLDASDDTLVRRFESVRRPHPLQGEDDRLLDAIRRERDVLSPVREAAEIIVDTSGLNVHQLSRKTSPIFMTQAAERVRVAVLSFGFKYGVPLDADFVFDLRFLPNPHWVPELRPHTGRERQVSEFVLGQPGAKEFVDGVDALLQPVIAGYLRENRRYITVAVGCTGGKHRSVAVAEALAAKLASDEVATFVVHRDLGQE